MIILVKTSEGTKYWNAPRVKRRGVGWQVAVVLRVEVQPHGHIRFLDNKNAIADARYEVTNEDGSKRKMWSTFIVKLEDKRWKIAAIRNMLPAQ